MSLAVMKCGGSFLRRQDGVHVIRTCVGEVLKRHSRVVVITGGGEAADLVRRWAGWWKLADEDAHWLAIEAMGFNTRVLAAAAFPEAPLAHTVEQLIGAGERLVLAEPVELVRDAERTLGVTLPRSWRVTSDSLALLVAAAVRAEELILLKPRPVSDLAQAISERVVDEYLAELAARYPSVCIRFAASGTDSAPG